MSTRQRRLASAAAAISVAMAFGVSADAQDNPCVSGSVSHVGMMAPIGGSLRTNFPFSGIVKTSFEQKLADGNVIRSVALARFARDSSGRTMTETHVGCMAGSDGQMHEIMTVNVYYPVAETRIDWQVGNDTLPKVAHVNQQPQIQVRQPDPDPAELERRQKAMQAAQVRMQQQRSLIRTENLGIKDFNGFPAEGTRTTRTIPAGKEGNDQPLKVIHETWQSKELGLTLMSISDDPRRGRTTSEYEELNRAEPDHALFAPPAGYTMVDVHGISTVSTQISQEPSPLEATASHAQDTVTVVNCPGQEPLIVPVQVDCSNVADPATRSFCQPFAENQACRVIPAYRKITGIHLEDLCPKIKYTIYDKDKWPSKLSEYGGYTVGCSTDYMADYSLLLKSKIGPYDVHEILHVYQSTLGILPNSHILFGSSMAEATRLIGGNKVYVSAMTLRREVNRIQAEFEKGTIKPETQCAEAEVYTEESLYLKDTNNVQQFYLKLVRDGKMDMADAQSRFIRMYDIVSGGTAKPYLLSHGCPPF